MDFRTYNEAYTYLAFEELVRQGIHTFFISPGSRSSPLVLAADTLSKHYPQITLKTHFDERGLGFMALGYAKSNQKPCVVITTSGSAVANLLPAIVEANQSHTPLIIITADRPFELLNNGANQAISQTSIFKDFICEQLNISECHPKFCLESLLSKLGHTVYKSQKLKKPVHINWHFQEPLCPVEQNESVSLSQGIHSWIQTKIPWTQFNQKVQCKNKTLICVGGFLSHSDQNIILKIGEKINAPIFWDVQNTFRFQVHRLNISNFDILLDHIEIQADTILHFGGSLTSKRLNQWIEKTNADYFRIYPEIENMDFMNKQKTMIHETYSHILSSLSENQSTDFLSKLQSDSAKIKNYIETHFSKLSEMTLPYHILTHVKDCNLFVGSSMPIRDLERFGITGNVRIYSNRGASGIDGNIGTAIGIAISTQIQTLAYVGDLTFLYDMNSLALVQELSCPFKVLVINNQGGGIFSFLPISNIQKETFEKFFRTPHALKFKECAHFFNLKYFKINSLSDLIEALNYNGHCIMEYESEIESNVKEHRDFTQKIKDIF